MAVKHVNVDKLDLPLSQRGRIGKKFICFLPVCFGKTDQNLMICFRQIIHNAVDIGFDILRAVDADAVIRKYMQCVGNPDWPPKQLMQCGVLVNPDDFPDWDKRDSISGKFNEKMLRNKHVFGGKLRQIGKLFFR